MEYIRDQLHEQVTSLRGLLRNKRMLTYSVLNLAMIVLSALMLWKGFMLLSDSDSPVVVVLSDSMKPAFQRGDILLLNNNAADLDVGDIVVFKITGRDIPIVHRILRKHAHRNETGDGAVEFLTKGDNNQVDDRNLYAPGQLWLRRSEVVGKAFASVPYAGMATILLNDYPAAKWILLSVMSVFVLTSREG